MSAVSTAQEFAHNAAASAKQEVKGAVGNDLIQIIAVVGFIALFGGGIILGLDAMTDAVENGSTAETFLQDSVDAFMVVPGLLEVIVVFGFVSVLIGLLWFAMSRMGLGKRMGGGL